MTTEHYELLYIIPLKFAGDLLQPIIEDVAKQIKNLGGEIKRDDNLGRMKFAYPIKHNNQGFYILVEFDLKKTKLAKLQKYFSLKQEVLRYMLVKKTFQEGAPVKMFGLGETEDVAATDVISEATAPAQEVAIKEQEVQEQEPKEEVKIEPEETKAEEIAEEVKEDTKRTKTKEDVEPEKEEAEEKKADKEPKKEEDNKTVKEKKKKQPKVTLDELDKKLDEILDTDNIL